MRICVLTPTFLPDLGGVEVAIDELVRAWRGRGHEVGVLAERPRALPLPRDGYGYPVRHHRRLRSLRWGLRPARAALESWHREQAFDLVHAHMAYPAGWAACRWSQGSGVPVVITCQGGDVSETSRFRTRPKIMERLRWCLGEADAVTAVSGDLARALTGLGCERSVHVVPNGVDENLARPVTTDFSPPWSSSLPFALYVKRLHPRKGHRALLQAWALLGAEAPHLVLCGTGPEEPALRVLAGELGLSDRVRFLGNVVGDKKRWLLQHCRLFVHPSEREGLPLSILEAMVCGRAVVATASEGARELIEEGVEGRLVSTTDASALAVVLRRCLLDDDLLAMGSRARTRAGSYHWNLVASRYEALFHEVLEAHVASRS